MRIGRTSGRLALAIAALLVQLSIEPAARQQASTAPLPTGAISGVVTDATTNRPVEGAIVSLGRIDRVDRTDPNGSIPPSPSLPQMLTDSRGRFVFRNLPASDGYYLAARHLGYAPTRYGWTTPKGSLSVRDIRRIPVADGQWVNTIAIPLWRLGAMTGRVVDERGEPVVGVAVRVFSRARISGGMQWVGGMIATTDDRGIYRIADLDPGAYVVGALSVQSTVLDTTPDVRPHLAVGEIETGAIMAGTETSFVSGPAIDVDGTHRLAITNFATPPPPDARAGRAYPPTFYPDARTLEAAVPQTVDYGGERNGLDIHLRPVPAVRISGRLDGGPDALPPNFLLRLMPVGDESLGFGSEVATTIAERDGAFTFLNVPAGQYTLVAQPSVIDFTTGAAFRRIPDAPGYSSSRVSVGGLDGAPNLEVLTRNGVPQPVWARTPIVVGTEDMTGLVVPLRRTVRIRGRVVFAPGVTPPPDDIQLQITADPASGDPGLGQAFGSTAINDPARTFAIDGLLTGPYVLNFGYGIVSMVIDGEDVRDASVDATPGVDINDVVVTVTDKFARLTGIVRDSSGPAPAAIIVFPADRTRWTNYGWHPQRFRTSTAGPDGTFDANRLPEGSYYVVAVDAAKRDAWIDPDFLEAASSVATPVTVKWGETKLMSLTVSTVPVK